MKLRSDTTLARVEKLGDLSAPVKELKQKAAEEELNPSVDRMSMRGAGQCQV
jgi:hypothetical protein